MPQNIIFYFTDQQRWDTCGCYGQPLDIPYLPEYAFSEGVAVVRDDHNRHYYIDVNGNDVFPQPQS